MKQLRASISVLGRPVILGMLIIFAGIFIVFLSYTAQNGLPLANTYRLVVDVPNAAEMTKNADVRIGGARVGQVLMISAQPGRGNKPPFSRLELALDRAKAGDLPIDTRSKIRLASLLGGKYLELTPGGSERILTDGDRIGLALATPIVDLDQTFKTFGGETATGLRNVIGQLGDSLVGRGAGLNDAFGTTRRLLPPLQRVLATLTAPRTGLAEFLDGAAAATSALAPLADQINALIDNGTTTLAALDDAGDALGETIDELAPTETTATRTLRNLQPVLADAAGLTRDLQPAAEILPLAARRLDGVIRTTTPVLGRVPKLADPLNATFTAVDRFARDPAAIGSIRALNNNDFATFGTSLFIGLGGILREASEGQLNCNVLGLWARNVSSALSDGDQAGSWLTFVPVNNAGQQQQVSQPSPDLHFNPYPKEDSAACEAGNERYADGQAIGNPAATNGSSVDLTARPAGVAARAAAARSKR